MTAPAKPAKGSAAKAKRARRRAILLAETRAKIDAKERDGWACRRCHVDNAMFPFVLIEAAHIDDKGMGGDHGTRSSKPSDYVTLCADCHRGPCSVHSGHLVMVVGPERGDGPVTFKEREL